MNKYDELYIFRQATLEDTEMIMEFIRGNWRPGHILGLDKEFFLYEHGDRKDVNFIICEDKFSKEFIGISGFIPYSKSPNYRHVCGVMTMVKKDVSTPMVGVELIKRFIKITNYKTYCGIGTNPKTMVPLVKNIFKRHTGKMEHYYRLNTRIDNFKIAKILEKKVLSIPKNNLEVDLKYVKEISELDEFDFKKIFPYLPYKDREYFEKRYLRHPIYNYEILKVVKKNEIIALLVGREINLINSKILRVVDFIGDINDLSKLSSNFERLLVENNYEYIDFLVAGMSEEIMNKAGFILKQEQDKNIIPNYFEPYVQENVEIWYETSEKNMIIFKGDADADRPNFRN